MRRAHFALLEGKRGHMKKHLVVAAVGVALAGAAAIPAGSAFAKKPPSAVAIAIHCAILQSYDAQLDAQILTATGTQKAILEALEDSNDARMTALSPTCTD